MGLCCYLKLETNCALILGRGGCEVVSVLAFLSDNPSSNPAEAYSFSLKFVLGKNENKQKEPGFVFGKNENKQKNHALAHFEKNCEVIRLQIKLPFLL